MRLKASGESGWLLVEVCSALVIVDYLGGGLYWGETGRFFGWLLSFVLVPVLSDGLW